MIGYLVSGLHSGAYCYLYNYEGKYLGNLRDEVFFCEKHIKNNK